jgi:hypothetical protein
MDEPALDFKGVILSPKKEAVRVFYKELWDHADKSLIPSIFHDGFTFRGSLGPYSDDMACTHERLHCSRLMSDRDTPQRTR